MDNFINMNLYEDLPPVSGKSAASNSIIGSAWSNVSSHSAPTGSLEAANVGKKEAPQTKVSINSESSRPITNESNVLSKPSATKPFLPSSLLFKPRQTTTATQKQKQNDSTSLKVEVAPSIQNFLPDLSNASQQNASEEKYEYFNSNTSFDVDEPYDPRRPNDYIAFCQEREESKRLGRLAEENKKKLEELENARQELERKRRDAAEKKDYYALVRAVGEDDNKTFPVSAQGVNLSRGRGRGVANLPAWITQQMDLVPNHEIQTNNPAQFADALPLSIDGINTIKGDKTATLEHTHISGTKRKATYMSKPSRVILLKNMAKICEIDEELKSEISVEFKKFGDVISTVFYTVNKTLFPRCPEHEEVRVFVQFDRQDSAIRAWKDMNGRFFGGKKVSVEYFSESKFLSSELEPRNDEW